MDMSIFFSLVTLSPPAIEWSHATGMLTPLLQCLSAWTEQTTTGATQVKQLTYVCADLGQLELCCRWTEYRAWLLFFTVWPTTMPVSLKRYNCTYYSKS